VVVGSSVLAAPFQNKLQARLRDLYWEAYAFVIQTVNAAGHLPGTELPKGPAEIVEDGVAKVMELLQRPATWTIREQKAVQEWVAAKWELDHGNGTS
jgi:hypothetical protein